MREDDLEISRQESKRARDERLAKERGMIRLFTPNEEDILKKGLRESEMLTDIGDRMDEEIKHILRNN
jgi:hypothetical protein